ncbi:MAG: FAD-dependent oxidoreductase [Victivallales bacterium]|nr:FAD-dependent oxidoreductase [Victivallales bacterium]
MTLQLPTINHVDVLVVANDRQGMEYARKLRHQGYQVSLAFIGDSWPGMSEAHPDHLRQLLAELPEILFEMLPVAPLLFESRRVAGWVFLSRGGYLAIQAKTTVDSTMPGILKGQLPQDIPYEGFLPAMGEVPPAQSFAGDASRKLFTPTYTATSSMREELLWHYESPRYHHLPHDIFFELPQHGEESFTEVLVVGGGASGAAAAIAAAQSGVEVICAEAQNHLGGTISSTLPDHSAGTTRKGFALRCAIGMAQCRMEKWLLDTARNAGVEVYLNTRLGGVLRSKRQITGVLLLDSAGRPRIVHAKVVIDATGNALVAMAAGASASILIPDEPANQGTGTATLGTIRLNAYTQEIPFCENDALDVTHTRLQACSTPGEQGKIHPSEHFRIVGDLTIQTHDIILSRHYRDTIGVSHGAFTATGSDAHSLLLSLIPSATNWEAWIPLRTLLPLKLDGLLTTGMGFSAHWDALPVLCHPADIQNLGYATGLVAAAAAAQNRPLREVPLAPIQRRLVEEGILPASALAVVEDENGAVLTPDRLPLYQAAAIFQRPDRARRQLQAAFEHHPSLLVAEILAFLGDSSGRDLLKHTIFHSQWENEVSPSVNTPVDRAILALRIIGGGVTALLQKLQELDASSPFSHLRAICLYLQRWPSKEAIPHLECILTTPGFAGHASSHTAQDALPQLKELYVAGALKACQPESELAEASLVAYQNSPCLLFAVYAEKLRRQN